MDATLRPFATAVASTVATHRFVRLVMPESGEQANGGAPAPLVVAPTAVTAPATAPATAPVGAAPPGLSMEDIDKEQAEVDKAYKESASKFRRKRKACLQSQKDELDATLTAKTAEERDACLGDEKLVSKINLLEAQYDKQRAVISQLNAEADKTLSSHTLIKAQKTKQEVVISRLNAEKLELQKKSESMDARIASLDVD